MSQILDLIVASPATGWALIVVAGVWGLLALVAGIVATFHPSPVRQESALRVLHTLLRSPSTTGRVRHSGSNDRLHPLATRNREHGGVQGGTGQQLRRRSAS